MARLTEKQIEATLTASTLALTNALADAEIAALLAIRGYSVERINEGLALVQALQVRQEARVAAMGEQLAATDQFKAAFAAARAAYTDLRETARACFGSEAQNREAWQTLGLGGTVPDNVEKFIGAAYVTLGNALADEELLAALTLYGYDAAGLQATRTAIEAVDAANQVQERAKGDSQRATAQRDEALKALRTWMGAFKRVARRVLKERPDLLVKLGL